MSNQPKGVPVSKRALFQRVKRKLAKRSIVFHETRGGSASRWYADLGPYYAVDDRDHICLSHVNLEEFARELVVLKPWEKLVE